MLLQVEVGELMLAIVFCSARQVRPRNADVPSRLLVSAGLAGCTVRQSTSQTKFEALIQPAFRRYAALSVWRNCQLLQPTRPRLKIINYICGRMRPRDC